METTLEWNFWSKSKIYISQFQVPSLLLIPIGQKKSKFHRWLDANKKKGEKVWEIWYRKIIFVCGLLAHYLNCHLMADTCIYWWFCNSICFKNYFLKKFKHRMTTKEFIEQIFNFHTSKSPHSNAWKEKRSNFIALICNLCLRGGTKSHFLFFQ